MRRRQVLALSIAAVAGCTGGNADGSDLTGTTSTATTTTTSPDTTTREPCSTDFEIENPPARPDSLSGAAGAVVETVERQIARMFFEPDDYFHFSMDRVSTTDVEAGIRHDARVEVDFASSGDSEDSTTVEYHLFYEISYRLTDRRVVRAEAERVETGTVVCW